MTHYCKDLQLYPTDERAKETHHAEELDAAQVLDGVLLTDVRRGVQNGAQQDQTVAQQHVTACRGQKRFY